MKYLTVKGKLLLREIVLLLTSAFFVIAFFAPTVRIEWQETVLNGTESYYVCVSPFSLIREKTEAQVKLADKKSVEKLKDLDMTDSQIDELLGTRDVFYKISQRGEDAENTSDPIGGFKSAIQMFGGLLKYAFWVYIARLIVGIIFTLTTKRSLQIAKEDEDRILKVSGGVYQVMDIISFALFAPWIAYLMLIGRWDQLLSLSGLNYTFNRVFFAVTIVIYAIRVLIFFVLDYYIKRDLMADKELTLEVVKTMPLQKGARINKQISAADTADALLKYKQLLDEGVFTQEEFDQKKRELLSKQEKE